MNRLVDKVSTFIVTNRLIEPGSRVVVALSGGADSVALTLILKELGVDLLAAHCNFHLRGEESDRDCEFVRNFCQKLCIPLMTVDFDVDARRHETGESIEMACRSLRYEWFENIREREGASSIAVAHHRDDNVETFFLNALRGSGVAGLKGMLPRNGYIIRPLLGVSRREIEEYLNEKEVGYVTDSTNAENEFKRNRIRNRLLPLLEELFPGASRRIADSIDCLRGNYQLLSDYKDDLRHRFSNPDGEIDVTALVNRHPHPDQALLELCRDSGFNIEMARDVVGRPERAGLMFGSFTLDRGILRPIKETALESQAVTPGVSPLEMRLISREEFHPRREPLMAWFDSAVLAGNPRFEIRSWRVSDRFRPFGLHGSKKLSDLFLDHHLDDNRKRRIPVLTRDGEILWVVGLRQSALFPVTDSTSEIVELKWIKS